MSDYPDADRKNASQRRDPNNTIGFERHGILEDTSYEPPQGFPEDAKKYLVGRSRCGTLSGGAKLAGISVNRIYEFRRKIGEEFREEEDIADSCMTDAMEESLMRCGLGEVTGSARVRALEAALKANRPEKYNQADNHNVELNGKMTWLDIIKRSDDEE